jgi:hypothetical protein
MAGGFGGTGAPLHARTRTNPTSAAGSGRADCPARHCWVTAPADGGGPRPGLLLEWRRGAQGWEGRVAYAAELRPGRWAAVEEWLPAEVVAASAERTTPPRPDLGSAP